MKWYVVHTQTGAEERAKAGLDSRIATTALKQYVGEVVVPTEQVSDTGFRRLPASCEKHRGNKGVAAVGPTVAAWLGTVETSPPPEVRAF